MALLRPDNVLDIAPEIDREVDEVSDERFDRAEFARRALELVAPAQTTVAICPGARRMHVSAGRAWGRAPGARWAVLAIPDHASRRAIALAVAELARAPGPYVLDVLQAESGATPRAS
jgi:hypothetical protein